MDAAHSDALVFFGITGDLAYKKSSRRSKRW
jgi:glucose-6-phosphate 1-dehydrogenase